jgi:hypothetical protein
MAITCRVDLDTLKVRAEIRSIYARVAADPTTSTFIAGLRTRPSDSVITRPNCRTCPVQ